MSHRLPFHRYLVLVCVMLGAPIGDALLKRGMQDVGEVSIQHLLTLLHVLTDPWIIAGILVLIGFMAMYMTALTWADITFVLPATAFSHVVTVLISRYLLHEAISWKRLLGITLIVVGAGFVARGPALTEENLAENRLPKEAV